MVLRVGDEVGCGVVDELMLAVPLVLPAEGGVRVQVVVGGAGESGRRTVSVFSRGEDGRWVLHAEGVLGVGVAQPLSDLSGWPPVGRRRWMCRMVMVGRLGLRVWSGVSGVAGVVAPG